jgi:hypothetical protein
MTNQTHPGFLTMVLAAGLAACNGNGPAAPSSVAPPAVPAPIARPSGFFYGNGYTLNGVSLSGVVSVTTPEGQTPIAGAIVYCDACGASGHTWATTDANGNYRFSGDLDAGGGIWLSGVPTPLLMSGERYDVLINGDTRFDIQLVKR